MCKLCQKSFRKKKHLQSHTRIHSEDQKAFHRNISDEELAFACEYTECGLKFISEHVRTYHFNSNHKEMEFKHLQKGSAKSEANCPLCYIKFKSFYSMHAHILDIHSEDKDLLKEGAMKISPDVACPYCELKFVRSSILSYHISRIHKQGRGFQCEDCPLMFKLQTKLILHNFNIHKKKLKRSPFRDYINECKLCYQKYQRKSNLTMHQKKFHSEDIFYLKSDILKEQLTFYCLSCQTSFVSDNILKYHIRREHTEKFNCKLCHYDFKSKRSYEDHIRNLHITDKEMRALESSHIGDEILVYICKDCPQRFLTENILKFYSRYRHKRQTTDNSVNSYCKLCYHDFKSMANFTTHKQKLHHDEMSLFDVQIDESQLKHNCKQCEKIFHSEKVLSYHTRYFHVEKSGVVKYCKLCYIKFKHPSEFRKHKKSLHQKEMYAFISKQEVCELKYPCNKCDKKFLTENILQYHSRYSHKTQLSGQEKTCQYCNKHFPWHIKTTSRLAKHMRSVHCLDKGYVEEFTQSDETLANFQYMMAMLNKR